MSEEITQAITDIYKQASNKPSNKPLDRGDGKREQESKEETEKQSELTVLDTFAIPIEFLESEKVFKKWFEDRFFELDDRGIERFTRRIQEATNFIKKESFILSPRDGESFPLSKAIQKIIEKGFNNIEDIRSFLRTVAIDNKPQNVKKFFTPNAETKAGAKRLSVCRILSVAYAIEYIKNSNDLKKFFEYSKFVLGRADESHSEGGLLSSLVFNGKLDIFDIDSEFDILQWLGKKQLFKSCNLNNIGRVDNKRSYHIPEVEISFKDGLRGLLKIMRDPSKETRLLDDFLRLRFLFSDNTNTEDILELMMDLDEEAKSKKKPLVEIEFRENNYLTRKQISEYFPDKIKRKKNKRSGILRKIKIDKNVSSGGGYKKMSVKIKLIDFETREKVFSFEIQFLRESEHRNNERIESKSNHFLLEMKQVAMFISRMNGKLTKEEFVYSLKEYLDKHIKTEKIPQILIDDIEYTLNKETRSSNDLGVFQKEFSGSVSEKAEKLFDFLFEIGELRKVPPQFPTKRKPSRDIRGDSKYYLHKISMFRIIDFLRYSK